MWDRLLAIVVVSGIPLEGIYGDASRGVCTQSLVFSEQPEEISLQIFTRIKNVSYHMKSCIIIS